MGYQEWQVVTCDVNAGLECIGDQQTVHPVCEDYEIRVKCCHNSQEVPVTTTTAAPKPTPVVTTTTAEVPVTTTTEAEVPVTTTTAGEVPVTTTEGAPATDEVTQIQ